VPITDSYSLLAAHPDGARRRGVLRSDDDAYSVRTKVLVDDDGDDLLQLRVEIASEGYLHLVVDCHRQLVAMSTGSTDDDAWQRVKGELQRKGYDLR
jgi:hypothetical protein